MMDKARKRQPGQIEFETYNDGLPIIFNVTADGKPIPRGEYAKKLLRTYLGIHHRTSGVSLSSCRTDPLAEWAAGSTTVRTPWALMAKQPEKFFEPGMLPEEVSINDPEHMPMDAVVAVINHIVSIENPPEDSEEEPVRFMLLSWGKDRNIYDADYTEPVAPVKKKGGGRKRRTAATFASGPRDADEEDEPIEGRKGHRKASKASRKRERLAKAARKKAGKKAKAEESDAESSEELDSSADKEPWRAGEKTFDLGDEETSTVSSNDGREREPSGAGAAEDDDEEAPNPDADIETGPPSREPSGGGNGTPSAPPKVTGDKSAKRSATKSKGKGKATENNIDFRHGRLAPSLLKDAPAYKVEYFRHFCQIAGYQNSTLR